MDVKFALLHCDLIYLLPVSHAHKNKCRGYYHNVGILLSHKLTHRTMELRQADPSCLNREVGFIPLDVAPLDVALENAPILYANTRFTSSLIKISI